MPRRRHRQEPMCNTHPACPSPPACSTALLRPNQQCSSLHVHRTHMPSPCRTWGNAAEFAGNGETAVTRRNSQSFPHHTPGGV
eukprot:gene19226-biopygen22022